MRTLSLATLCALAACGGEIVGEQNQDPALVEVEALRREYNAAFERAGAAFGVPAELLKAISFVETRWYMVPGAPSEFEGQEPAYGLMALRGEALARGARLAGLSVAAVRTQPEANIRAAAALLRAEADALGLARDRLGAWAPAVARLSGITNPDAAAHHVHEGVYRALRDGVSGEERTALPATLRGTGAVTPELAAPSPAWSGLLRTLDYSGARWRPAPASNFTSGRSRAVELLVIHTCAGGYSGCVGWLTTPYPQNPYKTSAHYVVNESGSEISQLVRESDTAHHVGASWQGAPTNPRSVGIEHGGFSYDGSNRWTEGQVAASAQLSCDIVKRQGIIRDRQHIIGHYQPDPVNRANDPGRDFPWADYMNRINKCLGGGGGGGGGGVITIDSNQANNGPDAQVDAAAATPAWASSQNVAGYWGSGYFVAPTAAVSDPMTFKFYLPAAADKEVFAWWTAAGDRSTTTPFVIFDSAGTKLGTSVQNQQGGGGRWNSLGSYRFSAGWNKIAVSRWTTPGAYVIADAIQVR